MTEKDITKWVALYLGASQNKRPSFTTKNTK